MSYYTEVRAWKRAYFQRLLAENDGAVGRVSKVSGVNRGQLYKMLKSLGVTYPSRLKRGNAARVIFSAFKTDLSEDVNHYRTDLLRQQLRAREIPFEEASARDFTTFHVDSGPGHAMWSVVFNEILRLARRYGQSFILVYPGDGSGLRYNLAPGQGGPSVTSITEL